MTLWWTWASLGLTFLAIEVAQVGSFVSFFLAVGALGTAVVLGAGLLDQAWQASVCFALLSTTSLVAFRQRLRGAKAPTTRDFLAATDSMAGEHAVATVAMAAQGLGAVECRGSPWQAINTGQVIIEQGQVCYVDAVDNLTLKVTAFASADIALEEAKKKASL